MGKILRSLTAIVAGLVIGGITWSVLPETGLIDKERNHITSSKPEINQPQRYIGTIIAGSLAAAGTLYITRPRPYDQYRN